MIDVQGVTKSFDGAVAVDDLSFTAPDRAISALLGANGAGKTTTLRMIAGVLEADAGDIRIETPGRPAGAQSGVLGALLDHAGLYARLTARENMAYFGRLRGLAPASLEARVERILVDLGLDAIADRRVGGLSQGQRMKVALGRVLIHEPTHLLLDEPTNGLDVPTVRALREILRALRDAGACILFSSHVLGEVESLCDRIVVIANGEAVAQGTRDELCEAAAATTLEEAFISLTASHGGTSCRAH